MHELNNDRTIGYSFFEKADSSNTKRLEYIFNHIYGVIPCMVNFSDEFEVSCLEVIEANYDRLCSDVTKLGDRLIEEGVWVGKPGTEYANTMLSVKHKAMSVDHDYDVTTRFIANMPEHERNEALENLHVGIRAAAIDRNKASIMFDLLEKHKFVKKSKMYMLANNYGDLTFIGMPIPEVEMDLALNYGDSFPEFHKSLVGSINEKSSGLYLFYGEPGTGKSSYIKYLLRGEIDRKIAYIPVSLIDKLTHPDMIPLLMSNKDIILILEDAEKALLSRENEDAHSALVSTILNLTDGFIGQALNITVIATFNTQKEKIDSALLRKGRLRRSYEFKKLDKANCKKIAEKLGIDPARVTEDMTLADIYNFEEETGAQKEEPVRRVGFN
jgi:predicted AAA+ superfamily ATPase